MSTTVVAVRDYTEYSHEHLTALLHAVTEQRDQAIHNLTCTATAATIVIDEILDELNRRNT